MKTNSNKMKMLATRLIPVFMLIVAPVMAQTEIKPESDSSAVFGNPTFLVLAFTAIILMAVIISLAASIRNLADSGARKNDKASGPNAGMILLLLIGSNLGVQAQEVDRSIGLPPMTIGGLDSWIFGSMMLLILVEFLIIITMVRSIRHLLIGLGYQKAPDEASRKPFINWKWLDRQLTDAVPIERESEVMTDHEYDGIRELDNNLPPWWIYGFYGTIIFAFVYLFDYHVFGTSPLQLEEYKTELAEAELEKNSRLKEVAASVDEETVIALTDAAALASGKDLYVGNCAACHGQGGEGLVGPNLTDVYWIHGGGIKNVFKTIKYGVPEKGMIAWQTQLNPESMQKVASYILTLQGTKPANPKDPQGEEWKEEVVAVSDSTTVSADSSVTINAN
jgi:cytochrome c oxidase cbb3-type subunit III